MASEKKTGEMASRFTLSPCLTLRSPQMEDAQYEISDFHNCRDCHGRLSRGSKGPALVKGEAKMRLIP